MTPYEQYGDMLFFTHFVCFLFCFFFLSIRLLQASIFLALNRNPFLVETPEQLCELENTRASINNGVSGKFIFW